MLHRLRAFFSLSLADQAVFLRAWFLLLAVDIALRLLPFRGVQSWLQLAPPAAPLSPEAARPILRQVLSLLDAAARHHLYPMTCLRRSLALQRLLAQRGLPTRLRFGVQRVPGGNPPGIQAHAWLEYNGQPIGERLAVEAQYAPLAAREAFL